MIKPTSSKPTDAALVTRDRNGLILSKELTHDQFMAIGQGFNRAADLYAWYVGDWVNYGQDRFKWGDKYTDAIEATGIDYGTLRNYALTSRAIPISRRQDRLSYTHHVAVTALDAEQQSYWLETAIEHGLTTRELQASIQEGQVMRVADLRTKRQQNAGLHGPHAIWATFNRAYRDCTARVPIEKWTEQTRQAWKTELQPIVELYNRL